MAPHALTLADVVAVIACASAGLVAVAIASVRILLGLIRRSRPISLANAGALLAGLLAVAFAVFVLGVNGAWDGTSRPASFWATASRVALAGLLISACWLLLRRGSAKHQARIRLKGV